VPKIKLDPHGFAHIDIFVRPKTTLKSPYISFKVDTGANSTTISRNTLRRLGFSDSWIKEEGEPAYPTLASGEVVEDCYNVILPEIQFGDYVGYNWPFLTSLSVQFRPLFGTDSMQFFNWVINYENNICHYELISSKRKVSFNQKGQSLHALDEVVVSDSCIDLTIFNSVTLNENERILLHYCKMTGGMKRTPKGDYDYFPKDMLMSTIGREKTEAAVISLLDKKYIKQEGENEYVLTAKGREIQIS
jgi:hypothetical protein